MASFLPFAAALCLFSLAIAEPFMGKKTLVVLDDASIVDTHSQVLGLLEGT